MGKGRRKMEAMKAYQMVIIASGPFRWRRGQVVPPMPKKEDDKYNVQLTDRVGALSISRKDLILLKGEKQKIF